MLSYLGGATQEVCQLSKEEVEDANSNYKWVLHEGLEMMVGVNRKLYENWVALHF